MVMANEAFLEGYISVEAAIRGGNRPLHHLYIRRGKWDRRVGRLVKQAEAQQIPVEQVDEAFIAERVEGQTHGGIIAAVGMRQFVDLGALLGKRERPFIIMLDGIEDPFNYGQAIRALYAAGVDGLVVRPRNWLSAVGIVARASAGTSELMSMAVAETADQAAVFYKQNGLHIACTTAERAVSIYEADLTAPMFLLIGGERRGITRSFMEMADSRLQIPYGRPFPHSLGAATSAAIIGFEWMRQRGEIQSYE
jgi:23S rRNA (guanosine2251-2'-O)-methyltransferase